MKQTKSKFPKKNQLYFLKCCSPHLNAELLTPGKKHICEKCYYWPEVDGLTLTISSSRLFSGVGLFDGERFENWNRSGIGNDDSLAGTIASVGRQSLNFTDNLHARQNLSENDVSSVQPWCGFGGEEELRSVGVLTSVGHAQPSSSVVLQLEVLIGKAFAVDGSAWKIKKKYCILMEILLFGVFYINLTSSSVATSEVTTLDHEILNDSVETAALVAFANHGLFGQLLKVFNGLWYSSSKQTNHYATSWSSTDCDIEEDLIKLNIERNLIFIRFKKKRP